MIMKEREFNEGDLIIDFSRAISAKKFDKKEHGLSHCMKAVDFVVELSDCIYFIELKDPQHPSATKSERDKFIKNLNSDTFLNKLKYKCRDSFLYELSIGNVKGKDVYYYVLIALDTLDASILSNLKDQLGMQIPINGPPNNPWQNKFIQGCMIFNLSAWQE